MQTLLVAMQTIINRFYDLKIKIKIKILLTEFRQKEKALLEKCQYLHCISTSMALLTPLIITMATILAFTLFKQTGLTAAKVCQTTRDVIDIMSNDWGSEGVRGAAITINLG